MNTYPSGDGAPEKSLPNSIDLGDQLLWNTKKVCYVLGDICPRTVSRLEKRGLISKVPLIRHKRYFPSDVVRLVENLRQWDSKSKVQP